MSIALVINFTSRMPVSDGLTKGTDFKVFDSKYPAFSVPLFYEFMDLTGTANDIYCIPPP